MNGFRRFTVSVATVVAVGACASAGAGAGAYQNPELSGTWLLDEANSQPIEPSARGRAGPGTDGTRRAPPGGRPGGGGGARGGTRMPRRQIDPEAIRLSFGSVLIGQDTLILQVSGDTVKIGRAGALTLRADGEERDVTFANGAVAKTKAEWREGELVIEHEHEGGLEFVETFSRVPGADRLIGRLEINGPQDREITRAFDLDPATTVEEPSPEAPAPARSPAGSAG